MQLQKNFLALSGATPRNTKEAWSAYVRRRWPTNCQVMCEREWDLTPGRANGLVWANVTQPTIDHILAHPRGGTMIALEVTALCFGLDVETFLERCALEEMGAIEREKRQFEARERRARALESVAHGRRHPVDRDRAPALHHRQAGSQRGLEAPRVGRAEALNARGFPLWQLALDDD